MEDTCLRQEIEFACLLNNFRFYVEQLQEILHEGEQKTRISVVGYVIALEQVLNL